MRSMHLPLTLPGGTLSQGLRYAWIAILALSPAAYFGATLLEDRLPHEPKFTSIGRDRAIEIAGSFARGVGIDTQGWTPGSSVESHGSIVGVFRKMRPPALERIAAPATIDVILSGSGRRWIKVNITPDGRTIGFITSKPAKQDTPALDEQAARKVAEDTLRRQLGADNPFAIGTPTGRELDKAGWEREFVWEAPIPGMTGSKAKFHVDVAGNQTVSLNSTITLDPALKEQVDPNKTRRLVLGIVAAVYYFALGIYALVRYVRRSIEREVSHRRTLLVVAVFAISGVVSAGLNGADTASSINGEPASGAAGIAVLLLALSIPGILFGVAYGAGEGDLREAFPGKMSSVDAFLSGKWFSANCARSILAGGAIGGWMLLVQNALLLLVRSEPIGNQTDLLEGVLQRSPLMGAVTGMSLNLTIMTAFGLMLPLALLHSRIKKPWLIYTLLLPFSTLVAQGSAPSGHSWQNNLVLQVIYAAAACAPFIFGDLLAAVSSLVALSFVDTLLRNSVVSDSWHAIAYNQVLPAGVIFLGVAAFCAWRGRVYGEAQVRPLYARHQAERLALTAEIGAARLAQVRLLPDAAPPITGLSIAGSCTPAREVGGDFFDYYALDDHRLGVFVAEGGNRELGSAMAIALAKGFLMYTARLDLTPVEILRRLRTTLGSVLRGENASMTVLYAIVDGRNRSVRYARSGSSPRIVINGNALAEEIVADRVDDSSAIEIRHGAATLAPNDVLFFYTDGWSGQIAEHTRGVPDEFLRKLRRQLPDAPAVAVHKAALSAAMKRRRESPPDDITAVVVRLEEMPAEAVEGIA